MKTDVITQSKGLAHMITVPKVSDIVYVSCNKLQIMKCIVITDFIVGLDEQTDQYNIGLNRIHTNNNTYLQMKIIEIFDNPIILKGCQRTWCKYL